MKPFVKNLLAVLAGIILGSILNMTIIHYSGAVIPLPEGVDPTTFEGLKASIHLFEPKHFIMPFLAHALGTLAGAYTTARIAANNKQRFAIGIGIWFLIGGTINIIMLPSPLWFTIADLLLAYLPMAYIGGKLAAKQ